MHISTGSANLIFSIIIMVVACTPTASDVSIELPSFHKYYPILLEEAQKWQADAYLDEARIFMFPKFPDSNLISASFYSPSENLESLGVYLHQDETITSEAFSHGYPIYHHEPITENDWRIDSQEAMESMLVEAGQKFVNSTNSACSFMLLKRVLPAQNQPVIWSLTLWDCSDSVQHFYLDATSGELLDSSLINIQPTRFPTPTP
jgi:hypothetical protein